MTAKEPDTIIIRRNLRIGDLEAETDKELLLQCFVDNGTLNPIKDVTLPESIIVGRTGSGKTALLIEIASEQTYYRFLDLHNISIRFLEHSDIIEFFSALGVKLDLFYRLLWRHVITVELLKLHYGVRNEAENGGILAGLSKFVDRDPIKKEALKYFREWGDKFWIESDERIRQITEKLSRDVKAGMNAGISGVDLSLKGAQSLSTEQRAEVVKLATKVVSDLQIKKLSDLLDLLEDHVFDDRQKRYYLLIDKLDEDWAETETRLRFIRALIEEIKTFRKISQLKVVVALRKDLLEVVFDKTRDAGFQQEKYESYLLPIKWTRDDLKVLVERRIREVYRRQYTKQDVGFDDVFPSPKKANGQHAMEYLLERTLLRPRDIMQFVNECLAVAFNRERVSWHSIIAAEATYSQKRLKSLFEEWGEVYPSLHQYIELLRGLPETFTRSSLGGQKLDRLVTNLSLESPDPCVNAVRQLCDPALRNFSESDVIAEFMECFYRIGAIGVKISTTDPFLWADYDHATLSKGEIKRVNQIKIHKMLHRALGIQTAIVGT